MLSRHSVQLSTLVLKALLLSSNIPTTSATNISPSYFQRRQDLEICGSENLSQCNLVDLGLPESFCCNPKTYCLPGASNTTVICCPEGSSCSAILPIVCDLKSQDVDHSPGSLVKTVLLEGALVECGAGCCPWGYSCGASAGNEAACIRDADQDGFLEDNLPEPTTTSTSKAAPTSASETSTSTSAPETPTSAPPAASPSISSTPASPVESEKEGEKEGNDKTGLIAGSIVGAIAVVGAIAAGIFFCVRNRRRGASAGRGGPSGPERKRSSTSSFGNFISDPIINPDTLRSDFGRVQEAGSSRVTSANSGMTLSNVGGGVRPGVQTSIDRPWNKGTTGSNVKTPRIEPGPKVGLGRVLTSRGRTGAPQIGDIDMGLRATSIGSGSGSGSSRSGGGHEAQQRQPIHSPNPFQDESPHRYNHDDIPVSPKSSNSVVSPMTVSMVSGGTNSNRPYTPHAQTTRPYTPQQANNGNNNYNNHLGIATTTTTHGQYRAREPSGADIDVFADPATLADSPGLGRYSSQTTFSSMMEKANLGDVARGAPYVPAVGNINSHHQTPTRPPRGGS